MTVWRLIQRVLKSDKSDVKLVVKREEAPDTVKGFRYLINENYLTEIYGKPKEPDANVKGDDKRDDKGVMADDKSQPHAIWNQKIKIASLEVKLEGAKRRLEDKESLLAEVREEKEKRITEMKVQIEEKEKTTQQAFFQAGRLKGENEQLKKMLAAPKEPKKKKWWQ